MIIGVAAEAAHPAYRTSEGPSILEYVEAV